MRWTNKGNQFETYKSLFSKRNRFLLVGCETSRYYFKNVVCPEPFKHALDYANDERMLVELHDETHIIVVTEFGEKGQDILKRLMRAGYIRNVELLYYADPMWTDITDLNHPFVPMFAFYAMDKIYVSSSCIIPSSVCNLNCRDCLNFTPFLKKFETYDLQKVCDDEDLLFKWIDYSERFQISGGEALLYPQLKELIDYTGNKYRSRIGIFEIVINGTIVPSDEICRAFVEHDMTVYLDNYVAEIPAKMNHREEIIEKFTEFNVKWVDNTVKEWFSLNPLETDNSSKSDEELAKYFDYCNNPWHNFENGKMYSCNFSRFAMKAGLINECENDYYDFNTLTRDKRAELVEFLLGYTDKGYVDFCKRCSRWAGHNENRVPVAIQAKRGEIISE